MSATHQRQPSIVVIGSDAELPSVLASLDPRLQDPRRLQDLRTASEDTLRQSEGLLLTDKVTASDASHEILDLVRFYVDSGRPVLASGRGAHFLNAACQNAHAAPSEAEPALPPDAPAPSADANRTSIFLTVGSKTASTIGGSGWLTIRDATLCTISLAALAPELMPVAITDDSSVAAFEAPGHKWVIGVAWDIIANADQLPTGFGNLLEAFVDRTVG